MTEAHPLRCETCNHCDKDNGSYDPHFYTCKARHRIIFYFELELINDIGCASHSDAVEQKIIKSSSSAKSDKMDELWEFCKLNGVVVRDDLVGFPGEGGFLLLKILKKITELRTKER